MPKALREEPPSSSVARLLDMGAAARAVAAVPQLQPVGLDFPPPAQGAAQPDGPAPTPMSAARSLGERPDVARDLVLTRSADQVFLRFVKLYQDATGTRLNNSHVARALMKAIHHCMDTLEREAGRIGPLKLPSNARGRELDRERFEAKIADAIVAGIRAAAAFDPDRG